MNVGLLCVLWISWCIMHSILIDTSVAGFIKGRLPGLTRYYRLFYNGLSLITFTPLIVATRMADEPVIFAWEGYGVPVRILLLVLVFLLFKGGAKKYDMNYVLGLKQLHTGEEHLLLSDTEEFTETGVFAITRHPWYFGSLILLWSILPEYPQPVFLAACILSIYLVIGTMLEERKIVAQYGDSYRRYRRRVSMLFPWKWLRQFWQ
jgi:methanethiol S-methyltransferase